MARRGHISAERALDLFVYAPVGLLVAAAERLPEFVDVGRRVLHQEQAEPSPEGRTATEPLVGYDQLSAREILALLDDLDTEALRLLAEYETLNRNRRTVIGRVEQLLGDDS
jgi:hypothetical protein